jgi:hypothetical protein
VLGVPAGRRFTLAALTIQSPAPGQLITELDVILGIELDARVGTAGLEVCLLLGGDLQPLGCFEDRHVQLSGLRPGEYVIAAYVRRAPRGGRAGLRHGAVLRNVGGYDAATGRVVSFLGGGRGAIGGGGNSTRSADAFLASSLVVTRRFRVVPRAAPNGAGGAGGAGGGVVVEDAAHGAVRAVEAVRAAFDIAVQAAAEPAAEPAAVGGGSNLSPLRLAYSQIGASGERAAVGGGERFAPLQVEGMSGVAFRHFLNALVNRSGTAAAAGGAAARVRYLEIGCYKGSTAVSALFGNSGAHAVLVDNWSMFGGRRRRRPRAEFEANVAAASGAAARVAAFGGAPASYEVVATDVWDASFLRTTLPALGVFDVFFFDGPHGAADQYRAITEFANSMRSLTGAAAQSGGGGGGGEGVEGDEGGLAAAGATVVLVDDWNYARVREATLRGVRDAGLVTLLKREVRTAHRPIRDLAHGATGSLWHNGVGILVLARP